MEVTLTERKEAVIKEGDHPAEVTFPGAVFSLTAMRQWRNCCSVRRKVSYKASGPLKNLMQSYWT